MKREVSIRDIETAKHTHILCAKDDEVAPEDGFLASTFGSKELVKDIREDDVEQFIARNPILACAGYFVLVEETENGTMMDIVRHEKTKSDKSVFDIREHKRVM